MKEITQEVKYEAELNEKSQVLDRVNLALTEGMRFITITALSYPKPHYEITIAYKSQEEP
jgi:hypothetical protein